MAVGGYPVESRWRPSTLLWMVRLSVLGKRRSQGPIDAGALSSRGCVHYGVASENEKIVRQELAKELAA